jgi:hypothetical protein
VKNIDEVLRVKQEEKRRVEREVEALEIVRALLQEAGDPPAASQPEESRAKRWP